MADSRIIPARPDLAAKHLEGKVAAARFVDGTLKSVATPSAKLHRKPDADSLLDSELLMGERFTVYEDKDGWSWGQCELDSYVGYVRSSSLAVPYEVTHRVSVPATLLFAEPDFKSPVRLHISFGSRVFVAGRNGRFAELQTPHGMLYGALTHLTALTVRKRDFVSVAERLRDVPYLWGGRSHLGLDCSALVQLCLADTGIAAPRDSDLQRDALGNNIGAEAIHSLTRGDLIFWNKHVAIALDEKRIIHANAAAMAVSMHDAALFAKMVEATNGPIVAIRRF